jgi:hypothetical protein
MPLTHLKVEKAKLKEKQYKLSDERGMYLLIHPKGGKWWRLDYRYLIPVPNRRPEVNPSSREFPFNTPFPRVDR